MRIIKIKCLGDPPKDILILDGIPPYKSAFYWSSRQILRKIRKPWIRERERDEFDCLVTARMRLVVRNM